MPQPSRISLRARLAAQASVPEPALHAVGASARSGDFASSVAGRSEEVCGKSVLIATGDQLTAALALIALDGIAKRVILCPSDVEPEHLPHILETAEVSSIVSDSGIQTHAHPTVSNRMLCGSANDGNRKTADAEYSTEWVLLTSGTSGLPKLVVHTLDSLAGAIGRGSTSAETVVWSTFYDIRRYGGLQIFLRAVLTGSSMILSDPNESTPDFLTRARQSRVTHISGTPSHWRRALMSPEASALNPRYVRLSGEIADQGILDQLRSFYPNARISHAFASTEAGVAFDIDDGRAGFPADLLGKASGVELKVEDGSLRIRSSRTASRYLGQTAKPLADADGFVDTGDMLALEGDRYHFVGRRDGVINVGGLKVHPEEVEAVINHHPRVRMSIVRARKNPVTGALVVADVVLREISESPETNPAKMKEDILRHCRGALPTYKVPAILNFVSALGMADTGKLLRSHA